MDANIIHTTDDYLISVADLTVEQLEEIHRNLFELTERETNADLIDETVLGSFLDRTALFVNRVLISRLKEGVDD